MAVINTNLVCDLQNAVKVQYLDGNIFSQDNQGNVINVTVLDGVEPATLSGTISANIIRADGGTVAATGGTITDNVASITLPAAAYAIPGVVSIVIKNTNSSVVTTIAAIVANVYQSSTDTVVDPGTIIPSVQTLISAIETAVASIPADYSSLWTSLAPAFNSSANYVAGQYVTYNGGLYRFTTAHSGSWSSSDVVATNLGGDVSDLKSALYETDKGLEEVSGYVPMFFEQGSINTNTGALADSTTKIRSNLAKVNPSTQYTVYLTNNAGETLGPAVVYYKADGSFDSAVTNLGNKGTGENVFTITTPATAEFVRFRYNRASNTTILPSAIKQTVYNENSLIDNALLNFGNITTPGLDLDTGDFIHPGSWVLTDMANKPDHYPSSYIGRIVSIASTSSSSFGTIQMVVDNMGTLYIRYSKENGVWVNWKQYLDMPYYNDVKNKTIYSYGGISQSGLDLNSGDFINPGMWSINDTQYLPYHSPTYKRCRIICFASETGNSIYTYQIVIDADGKVYKRFSADNGKWTAWVCETALHSDIAFKTLFIDNQSFVNDYTINYDTGATGRVTRLMEKYDGATFETGISVTKDTLGKDASNTYNVYNYKVSNGVGTKPVVLVIFGEHGNEANSAEVGAYFYQEVTNGVLTKYLTYVDFWIVPLMNPWGYENKSRDNANGVNLNRDFPCEWNYYSDGHNNTGNYSLSQVETQYLYNLMKNNRNKILFLCNKHNTGSITTKINIQEDDLVGYTETSMKTDRILNEGLAKWQDAQVRQTDPWIESECATDISALPVIVNRINIVDGCLDLFANAIGIHGSLLEVCGAAVYSGESNPQYTTAHYTDLARLELDYLVNYIAKSIENNELLLSNDETLSKLTFRTRIEDGSATPLNLTWEQGSINTNTGEEAAATNRCRSDAGAVSPLRNVDISCKNNTGTAMGLFAIYYNSSNVRVSATSSMTIPANETVTLSLTPPAGSAYIRFRIQFSNNTTITPSDFTVSASNSAWENVEQYWNGNDLVNIV